MLAKYVEKMVHSIPGLDQIGYDLSEAIHQTVLEGGEPARRLADVLHGTWLGHPLHPVLTDIVIGAWSLGMLFDALALTSGSEAAAEVGDGLAAIGSAAAVPTALAGLADYSTVPQWATGTATLHAVLNNVSLLLYLGSLWQRRKGSRAVGVLLSTAAFAISGASAWIGGHMVYAQRVGVDHTPHELQPQEWTAVMAEGDLREGHSACVEVERCAVLLYRYGGTVYAASNVCPHAGGPLHEGTFDGFCVQCPWHDSVLDLRDGSVVHGPTTYPVPKYAARIRDGQIEVRVLER